MPRYDFKCPKCKIVVELEKSIHDDSLPVCCADGCDGNIAMDRLIGGSSFQLSGECWSKDGYSKRKM